MRQGTSWASSCACGSAQLLDAHISSQTRCAHLRMQARMSSHPTHTHHDCSSFCNWMSAGTMHVTTLSRPSHAWNSILWIGAAACAHCALGLRRRTSTSPSLPRRRERSHSQVDRQSCNISFAQHNTSVRCNASRMLCAPVFGTVQEVAQRQRRCCCL